MKTYECTMCKGIFEKEISDEEVNKEAKEIWGVNNASENENMVIVCDDCFNKVHPDKFPELRDKVKEELKKA